LVLNYHRIGDPDATPYDPSVFSATADEFRRHMELAASFGRILSLEQVADLAVSLTAPADGHFRILVTFDDGYLDNYEIAFPILRQMGIPAVFFLPTSFIGTGKIPWWDEVAYILRNAKRRQFSLTYPVIALIDLEAEGFHTSLAKVLHLRKDPAVSDPERFLNELVIAADSDRPGKSASRCFLDWDEAKRMLAGGMALGGHTVSHGILSQLSPEAQQQEINQCRADILSRTGTHALAFAYPVGRTDSFTAFTQSAVREAGFRLAFSFYGGLVSLPLPDPWDIPRVAVGFQSEVRLRLQLACARAFNRFAP
jgi:peptidoglycan/xylan/chitin deacetylase (PgdA/CDA1 family)